MAKQEQIKRSDQGPSKSKQIRDQQNEELANAPLEKPGGIEHDVSGVDDSLSDIDKILAENAQQQQAGQDAIDSADDILSPSSENNQLTPHDENFSGLQNNNSPQITNQSSATSTGFGDDPQQSSTSSDANSSNSSSPTVSDLESGLGKKSSDKDKDIPTEKGLLKNAEKSPKAKSSFITRKRNGIMAAVLIGSALGLGSIVQGPLQFLHFASLLEQFHLPFAEDQDTASITRVYRYIRDPNNPENRRLSEIGKRQANKLEELGRTRGMELAYDGGANRRLSGVTIDSSNTKAVAEFQRQLGNIERYRVQGPDGRIRYEINDLYGNSRRGRQAILAYSKTINQDIKKAGAIGRRILRTKAGISWRWLGDLRSRISDRLSFYERWKQNRNQKITEGARSNTDIRISEPETETTRPVQAVDAPDINTARLQIAGAGGLSIVGGVCLASGIANQVDELHHRLVWLAAMRTSAKQLSLGSHVRAMDVPDIEELKLENELFNTKEAVYKDVPLGGDSDATKDLVYKSINWSASSKLKEKFGERGGVDPDADMIPKLDSTDNPVVNFIQEIPLLGGVCEVANNVIIGPILDRLTGAGVVGVILENTAGEAVLGRLIDIATRAWVGVPLAIDTVVGPALWWVSDVGTLLNINEASVSSGGLDIPKEAEQQLNRQVYLDQRKEYAQKSFFTRIFDYKDPRSLVAQVIIRNNYSNNPIRYGGRALAALTPSAVVKPFTQPAYAATPGITSVQDQYYGLIRKGWTQEEIDHSLDESVDNASSNYERYIFQDTYNYYLDYSNEFAERCYGMSIKNNGSIVPLEDSSKHPASEKEGRADYCSGTASQVRDAAKNAMRDLQNELDDIAENYPEVSNPCDINDHTEQLCAKIGVLDTLISDMRPGEDGGNCSGVFYLPYADKHHLARTDLDNFRDSPDECANFPGEKLHQNTRIYLRDMVALQMASCANGADGQACEDMGVPTKTNSTGSAGSASSLIIGDPYTDSTDISCDPRTQDLGNHEGWASGRPFQVRLCALPNLESSSRESDPASSYYVEGADGQAIVNSRVSGAVFSMVEAANQAGHNLSATSSYRTYAHQEQLFIDNGRDSSRAARAGYSSHQAGTAIDFSGMGPIGSSKNCSQRATDSDNPQWVWLFDNAETYGYKQYAKEPWHWDPLPSGSRCDSSQP